MAGTERAVVSLSPGDAEALLPLSVEAGWNQVGDDWRFMLAHGRGIGVRNPDGRWIASALVLPLGHLHQLRTS